MTEKEQKESAYKHANHVDKVINHLLELFPPMKHKAFWLTYTRTLGSTLNIVNAVVSEEKGCKVEFICKTKT